MFIHHRFVQFIAAALCALGTTPAVRAADLQSPAPEVHGAISLPASNAVVHGTTLRYEPPTNKNCLGFWTRVEDWADWQFTVATPGAYEIEVWQGCGKGHGGSDVAVEVGGETFNFVVEDTGHFQNFVPRKVGRVNFAKPGAYSLALKPRRKKSVAVMDIRQVRLVPAKAPPPK